MWAGWYLDPRRPEAGWTRASNGETASQAHRRLLDATRHLRLPSHCRCLTGGGVPLINHRTDDEKRRC
jgi:hypothetical protein